MGHPLRTLGFDGNHVVNITESACGKTAFLQCADPGEDSENGEFYSGLVTAELKKSAAEHSERVSRDVPVEELYAGVVADNVRYNRAACRLLEVIFPFLFFTGCIVHVFDLLNEDLAKSLNSRRSSHGQNQ
jgi:hypothetical protein